MKKQITSTILGLILYQTLSIACPIRDYTYFTEAPKRNHIIIGKLNATGPMLAFNLNGQILPGFEKVKQGKYNRYNINEQDGILLNIIDKSYQFYDTRNGFMPIGESYASATLFSEGLAIVSAPSERLKIIDEKGTTIAQINDYKGKLIENAEQFSNGLAAVETEDGLWGFIDTKGNMVIEPQFTKVSFFNESYCVVESRKKRKVYTGIINKQGEFTFPLTLNIRLNEKVSNGLIGFKRHHESFGIMDTKGNEILTPSNNIHWIGPFNSSNMAVFSNGENFGVIDIKGKIIAKTKYTQIQLLDKSFIGFCQRSHSMQIMDFKGKEIKSLHLTSGIIQFPNTNYLTYENGEYILLDKNFNEITEQSIMSVAFCPRFKASFSPAARTDYFDTRKVLLSNKFSFKLNGIAGLKIGDDVPKMIKVFELNKNKYFDPIDAEEETMEPDKYDVDHVYANMFGRLIVPVVNDELTEEEMAERMADSLAAIESMYVDEEDLPSMYFDTLRYIEDKNKQQIRLIENKNIIFDYELMFSDFIKSNHFEERRNSCNTCSLVGTSINKNAKFTGFKVTINLDDKASGKAKFLIENLISELKSQGLEVTKLHNEYVISNLQCKSKKIGSIELDDDSRVIFAYTF